MNKEELKRWGFSEREDGEWFNGHLCRNMKVFKHFLNIKGLTEYDFINAVYELGKINGISEMQSEIQRTIGID